MSTKQASEPGKESLKTNTRDADPADAEKIVSAFVEEYVKYYGKYVDQNELEEFISGMNEDLNDDRKPEEKIRTVEAIEDGEGRFIGSGAIKFQDNLAELGSTIIAGKYRGKKNSGGNGIYHELFRDRHEDVKDMIEDDEDPVELAYTQLLADKSAATQHTADKHNYAVTGIYHKKFPVAYEGKGRATVVDMLWADSDIENQQEEVYVSEEVEDVVQAALENINNKKTETEDISREIINESRTRGESSYRMKSKAVDEPEDDPMNFAEIEVTVDVSSDYSWDDVMEEIEKAEKQIENEEGDYWVGVSLDVNSPVGADAAEALQEQGFEYAGFNPGKLDAGEENRDALELQYCPDDETYVKQFVNEAAEFMERTGMNFENPEDVDTDYEKSEALRI